ncbi:MAG: DUF4832 domain-containing protein [Candidatus Coatesbacteria bacterium]
MTGLATALLAAICVKAAGAAVSVDLGETDELLANPGIGWETFGQFADEDPNLAGLPSGVAYFRFYWRELEPVEGRIDFARLDGLLAHARKAGQTFAFRVMCAGTGGNYLEVPQWLKDGGCRGFEYTYGGDDEGAPGAKHWVPDMTDDRFLKAHVRLIRELGKRYDGNPTLDHVDVGTIGLWAEWHMSGTKVAMPPAKVQRGIVEAWAAAFPKTPVIAQIGSEESMRLAHTLTLGWRADCLGDFGGFDAHWNHMENAYPQEIAATGAADLWKAAPVAFETCWDMRKWKESGWDIRRIFDFALDQHASVINNKSAPIPEGTRPEVERAIRKLGYRLVLRRIGHAEGMIRGRMTWFDLSFENVGVAPPYRNWYPAVRIDDGEGHSAVFRARESVRGWLPGDHAVTIEAPISQTIKVGAYTVYAGIVDGTTGKPVLRLANKGREPDGWYRVSAIQRY